MKKVTIILPVRNSMPWLELTVDSIKKNTKYENFKIIFLESESTDGTAEYCDYLSKVYSTRIKVYHEKKEGVTKMINKGIEYADKDSDILLTQDDVVFPELLGKFCWLRRLIERADVFPNAGIVSCLNGGSVSGPTYCQDFRWVGTWCMYIKREVLDRGLRFDEQFNPGDGDDIDFTYQVTKAGFEIVYADFCVDHHRKFSIDRHEYEDPEIRKRNGLRFKAKWGLE